MEEVNRVEVVRQNLTKEMIAEVTDTFNMLADHHGRINQNKLHLCLKALGMNINEALDHCKHLPETVDLIKFAEIAHDCMRHSSWAATEMNEAFTLFDADNSGKLTNLELKRFFNKIGENLSMAELEDQLREYETDGEVHVSLS